MSKITLIEVGKAVALAKEQLGHLGYTAPIRVNYRISNHMSRALGNCRQRVDWNGLMVEITISINGDLPLEHLQGVAMHEYIHACMPIKEHHGYHFQKAARAVNVAYGYHVATYAGQEEVNALQAVQASKITLVPIVCDKCGYVHQVSTRKKVAKYPELFIHRGCGGHFHKN